VTEVRAILDTTAVLGYAAGSIHVGEVIAEVADEKATFGVPLPCLVEAARARTDRAHLSGVTCWRRTGTGRSFPTGLSDGGLSPGSG
jgi:hypothetical protein